MENELRPTSIPEPFATAREFKKLIAKLEWIGMEKEAAQLETVLETIAPEHFACVFPDATD